VAAAIVITGETAIETAIVEAIEIAFCCCCCCFGDDDACVCEFGLWELGVSVLTSFLFLPLVLRVLPFCLLVLSILCDCLHEFLV
jgi:hypothetical protein